MILLINEIRKILNKNYEEMYHKGCVTALYEINVNFSELSYSELKFCF